MNPKDQAPTLEDLHDEAMRVLEEALKHANYSPYPDGRIQVAEFIVSSVEDKAENDRRMTEAKAENDRRFEQLVRQVDAGIAGKEIK